MANAESVPDDGTADIDPLDAIAVILASNAQLQEAFEWFVRVDRTWPEFRSETELGRVASECRRYLTGELTALPAEAGSVDLPLH